MHSNTSSLPQPTLALSRLLLLPFQCAPSSHIALARVQRPWQLHSNRGPDAGAQRCNRIRKIDCDAGCGTCRKMGMPRGEWELGCAGLAVHYLCLL